MKEILGFVVVALILIIGIVFYKQWKKEPTLDEMVGQMILTGFRGTGEPQDEDIKVLHEDIKDGKVGGIILFYKDAQTGQLNRNIVSKEQLKTLISNFQNDAKIPLFVSVDQEGGTIKRLLPEHGFGEQLSAKKLGEIDDVKTTYNQARKIGDEMKEVGFNVDFAPCIDLSINKDNPIIAVRERAFSDNEELVIKHGQAFATGLEDSGLIYSYKHFPGHGSSANDSHNGVVDITSTWSEKEIEPYKKLVFTDMKGMVMIGHLMLTNIDDKYPASLSKKIITGMLREGMDFDGVVITDDIQMDAITKYFGKHEAYKLAILAGVDILLIGNNLYHDTYNARDAHKAVVEMVEKGEIPISRIKESYKRIMKLKENIK